MDWKPYTTPPAKSVCGYTANGEAELYIIAHLWDGRVMLCRYPESSDRIVNVRGVLATAIEVTGVAQGKELAGAYERGEDLTWANAWCHPQQEVT
jgi:hypothetical protein